MGKKGKRNRKKGEVGRQTKEKRLVDSFYAKLDKMEAEVSLYHKKDLFSKLVKKLEECIHFIEMNQDAILRLEKGVNNQEDFFNRISFFYGFLVQVFYHTHNNEKIPSVVKKFLLISEWKGHTATKEMLKSYYSYSLIFHGQLALLRQGDSTVEECLSLLNSWTSKVITHIDDGVDKTTQVMMENTVTLLTSMKEFDQAIAVGKQLEQLNGDKMTLAVVYLEQYRLGISDHSLLYNFMPSPLDDDYVHIDGFNNHARCILDLLVYAQWDSIFHKKASKGAIILVNKFVTAICEDHKCASCRQAVTESDVPFVCSGCRVACYCSLDHQRMNWKKDPLRGTCIGHKLLCPMMNVYRKWRQANDVGNDEVAKKWSRRLVKEIVYFLSHGLGLRLEERCCQKDV